MVEEGYNNNIFVTCVLSVCTPSKTNANLFSFSWNNLSPCNWCMPYIKKLYSRALEKKGIDRDSFKTYCMVIFCKIDIYI